MNEEINKIKSWGDDKGLLDNSKKLAQLAKLQEESGELAGAILKSNVKDQKDAIGDCVVVLTLLAEQLGFTIEECTKLAWNEIKDRTGKVSSDGSFIKD